MQVEFRSTIHNVKPHLKLVRELCNMQLGDLKKLIKEFEFLLNKNIIKFWLNYSLDKENGGFYGYIERDGTPQKDAPKGLVQASRFLWSFSTFYKHSPKEEYKSFAAEAFNFLTRCFLDKRNGGWFSFVNFNGTPKDKSKHLYGHSFAIYGLSKYFLTFKDKLALDLAFDTLEIVEKKGEDKNNNGYIESFSENWTPIPQDPELGTTGFHKTMNTHIHLMEAYTELYLASKDSFVKSRLENLIDIIINKIIDINRGCTKLFFEYDWTAVSSETSYGHDIELSWLLYESAKILGREKDQTILDSILSLADNVCKEAVDKKDGGIPRKTGERIWWEQAEGLVGFLNAFEVFRDSKYWDAFLNIYNWVVAKQVDNEYGEWYLGVSPEKVIRPQKCYRGKSPYHNGRACLEIIRRLKVLKESLNDKATD